MMTPSRIGVASSVSLDKGTFDSLIALDYAARNGFSPVQLYLDSRIIESPPAREEVRARARAHRLTIMLHAPGLLKLPEVGNEPTIQAALELLADESYRRVVYHYDETQPVEQSMAATESLCAAGITPCIENFHQLGGAVSARRHYEQFLDLLLATSKKSLPVVPVFDIPRAFHPGLELTADDASRLTIDVLRRIGSMGLPVLLHLIDTRGPRQIRSEWCALGDGMIPYAQIFRSTADIVRFDDVILEYEDRENPLPSRDFLQSLFGSLGR